MELKLALKVDDLDNVATIFADDITDGTVVEVRDKKGQKEEICVHGDVPYGHKIAVTDIPKGAHIMKYGESIDPQKRYSQAELDRYNADMYIQVQGSKREIHNWQHEKILDYMYVTDQHPLLNKSLW